MSRLKTHLLTALACLYLASLWVYQLPVSPPERILTKIFHPVQLLMLTDRTYQMYAPDPRPWKRIPFVEVRTDRNPVQFLKTPPGSHGSWGLLPALSREKWENFLDELSKALRGGRFFLTEAEGEAVFHRLADRICRDESSVEDPVRSVKMQARRVDYGELHGDIIWDTPETLESASCR